jgi:ElaB/YqjD/DUF883 family membrane-anchored ribosome-binding protein
VQQIEGESCVAFASEPGQPEDLQNEIARLRARLEVLLKERVTPAVAAAAGQAEEAVQAARETGDVLAGHIRERPLTSVLIAAGIGWITGRAMR